MAGRKKVWLVTGALAIATLAAPAAAQASLSDCNSNYMCVWGNNDFKWMIAERFHGNSEWVEPFDGDENNENDSWANRSVDYTGCLADGIDGGGDTGDRVTLHRNDNDNDLAWFNSDFASSMRTKGGC